MKINYKRKDGSYVPKIVVLVPAHNEQKEILRTLWALTAQHRAPDLMVCIPNGCTDNTAELARSVPGVIVLELPKLQHKKSEALNIAWNQYAKDADIVVCLDADTIIPPNAIADWEEEFLTDLASTPLPDISAREAMVGSLKSFFLGGNPVELAQALGGSSSKFTMPGTDFLTRLQRSEFAKWTDTALARRFTTVLAGTGCAISGEALRQVVAKLDRYGPWSYDSQVEDFELTYQIRKLGYRCQVSPTVRAYTDSMKTVKALWGQRMKWQVGTVDDLLSLGFNRLTLIDWWQQLAGLFMAFTRIVWVVLLASLTYLDALHFNLVWWVVVPLAFAVLELISARRIPHRDRIDLLYAVAIIPSEVFAWLRSGWFVAAWIEALASRVTGKRKDRWAAQYAAEAKKG